MAEIRQPIYRIRTPKKPYIYIFLCLSVLLLSVIFHGVMGVTMQEKAVAYPSLRDVPELAWKNLSGKRIWFGHQSVGFNILDGVGDLSKENSQIKLNLIKTSNPPTIKRPGLIHFLVGQNLDPQSKIDAFSNLIQENYDVKPDIAFFEFCFLDILSSADVPHVFKQYKTAMDKLIAAFPEITFIAVTVPLTAEPQGLERLKQGFKYQIKNLTNRYFQFKFENIKRAEFNDLLIQEYQGKIPIFDLAKAESTTPEGKEKQYKAQGAVYFTLLPEYTDDGGHLNQFGRKVVAEQLLILLANLSK